MVMQNEQSEQRYFKVRVVRGHCGSGKGFESTFYFACQTAMQALQKAKRMPSVKHSRLPLSVIEVSKEEYEEQLHTSSYHKEGQHMGQG